MSFIGTIQTFLVDRITDLGFVLTNEDNEYFLHRNESNHRFLEVDEQIKAFVYLDKKNREACTLYPPKITLTTAEFCEVVEVVPALGLFVHIGISKDMLIPKEDLPLDLKQWPKQKDLVLCILRNHRDRLIAKMLSKNEILELFPSIELSLGSKYIAYVYRITTDGLNLITDDKQVVFVYHSNMRGDYHIGEKVEVQILKKNETDYNGTLIQSKEDQITSDANKIMMYLEKHRGAMNITEDTDPEIIRVVFQMSKASFKRALGHLYKDKMILIENNKIIKL